MVQLSKKMIKRQRDIFFLVLEFRVGKSFFGLAPFSDSGTDFRHSLYAFDRWNVKIDLKDFRILPILKAQSGSFQKIVP